MNSLPLSEWIPARWNGNRSRSSSSPAATIRLAFGPHGDRLGPAGGDVGGVEGGEERAVVVAALVADQVDLHEPGHGVVPLAPGLHRDRRLQHRPGPGVADRLPGHQPGPGRGEPAVDRGRRHRQHLVDDGRCRSRPGGRGATGWRAAPAAPAAAASRSGRPAPPSSGSAAPPRRRRRAAPAPRLPRRWPPHACRPAPVRIALRAWSRCQPVTAHTASKIAPFSARVAFGHFASCAFVIAFRCANVNSIHE